MSQMREAFERWMLNDAKCIVGSTDPYPAGLERERWTCWQAAWKAAHEPLQAPVALEPTRGNFWKPHSIWASHGTFWRCAHGLTGLDGVNCNECEKPN